MYTKDRLSSMSGKVSGAWTNILTGETRPLDLRSNQLSYSCADAIARIISGDSSWVPKYIGFVYGTAAAPTGLSDPTSRSQSWTDLGENLSSIEGNVQIAALSRPPFTKADPGQTGVDEYTSNAVVFSAHTQTGVSTGYGFDTEDPSYAGQLADGSYLYHAVLLAKPSSVYVPLARVSLAVDSAFQAKPTGFELSLDWTVSFF